MSFENTDKKTDEILAKQQEEVEKKRNDFFRGLKQEIHSELNDLLDWRTFWSQSLKKDWDDLDTNKEVRSIISNLDICIEEHKKNCPICDPTRWGSKGNSFKEELCI